MLDKFRERKIAEFMHKVKEMGYNEGLYPEWYIKDFISDLISEVDEAIGKEIKTTDDKHGELGSGRGEIEYRNGSNNRKSQFEDKLNNKE